MAMGCRVEIETVPGNLPLLNDPKLTELFRKNAERIFGVDDFRHYPHVGGSTDAGDLSQLMPVLHPHMAGAKGKVHSPEWHIADFDDGYLAPAKTLAAMIIDLLCDEAARAREVQAHHQPAMSKDEYLKQQKSVFHTETFDGSQN